MSTRLSKWIINNCFVFFFFFPQWDLVGLISNGGKKKTFGFESLGKKTKVSIKEVRKLGEKK